MSSSARASNGSSGRRCSERRPSQASRLCRRTPHASLPPPRPPGIAAVDSIRGRGDSRRLQSPPGRLQVGSKLAIFWPRCQSNAPKGTICSDMREICDRSRAALNWQTCCKYNTPRRRRDPSLYGSVEGGETHVNSPPAGPDTLRYRLILPQNIFLRIGRDPHLSVAWHLQCVIDPTALRY